MGRLERSHDGLDFPLSEETLVGRSRAADLCIKREVVSGLHASVIRQDDRWLLRDLGSRNGTAVNGTPLPTGEARPLVCGDVISFGDRDESWTLTDDDPPIALAHGPDGLITRETDGLLALPSADEPVVTISHHVTRGWYIEDLDGQRAVEDREQVVLDGAAWSVRISQAITRTARAGLWELGRADLTLRGGESEGLYSVYLHQGTREESFQLGAGGPLFEMLARAWMADDPWVPRERIFQELRITSNHLNVMVFRVRQAFSRAGVADATDIIQRQRGRMRLGCGSLRVELNDDGDPRERSSL